MQEMLGEQILVHDFLSAFSIEILLFPFARKDLPTRLTLISSKKRGRQIACP